MQFVVLVPKPIIHVFAYDLVFFEMVLQITRIDDNIGHAVQDLFKVLQRDIQHVPDSTGNGLQKPDMRNWRRQDNMPHPLTANLGLDYLDTTLFTNNAAVFQSLVPTTITLVVFYWAKDFGTKQAIPFRLKRPVVDGFRFLYLTVRPLKDLLW